MSISAISSSPAFSASLSSIRVPSAQAELNVATAPAAAPAPSVAPVVAGPVASAAVSQAAISAMASNLAAQMAGIIEARLEYAASARIVQTVSQMQSAALNVLA